MPVVIPGPDGVYRVMSDEAALDQAQQYLDQRAMFLSDDDAPVSPEDERRARDYEDLALELIHQVESGLNEQDKATLPLDEYRPTPDTMSGVGRKSIDYERRKNAEAIARTYLLIEAAANGTRADEQVSVKAIPGHAGSFVVQGRGGPHQFASRQAADAEAERRRAGWT